MITIKPTGGLCNRLRVINSGVQLAEQINRPLKVLWTISPDLHCSYFSLFESPDTFEVIDVKYTKPPTSKRLKKIYSICSLGLKRLRYTIVLQQNRIDQLRKQNYDFNQLRSYKTIYISCCGRFYPFQQCFEFLRPVDQIQQVVDKYVEQYEAYTVGVHIRRTDHQVAIQFSPDDSFIKAMNDEIQKHPNVKFFIASDCPEVMSRFTSEFRSRVISHTKDFSRGTQKGVQDALVDLLCLSRTNKIIGSYYSSFSETAAHLKGIPLHKVTGDDQ